MLKIERNKKLGHSDADYDGSPYSVYTFNETEIRQAKQILGKIDEAFKRCTNGFDGSEYLFQQKNPQTRNFIDYHIVFEEFYSKNLKNAISERYTLKHKRNGEMPRKK